MEDTHLLSTSSSLKM
jgi:hypothetical protein